MITQATFEKIQNACMMVHNYGGDDVINVIFPKLFVLHNPSKRGFYVDKEGKVILSVSKCVEPEHKTKIPNSRFHVCPYWANVNLSKDFTTYILGEES